MKNLSTLPQHVAIIMDGNRRWARQNKFKIFAGHEKVANENIANLVDHCIELGIPYLTLWAFSTENWQREPNEVEAIMNIMRYSFVDGVGELIKKKVRLKTIGDLTKFPQDIQESIAKMTQSNLADYRITVTFALNYGGRDEILRAVNKIIEHKKAPTVTAAELEKYLDTTELPDVDLIIRTGGEQRLSGFLPWQSVYAEFYFTQVLMPDFDKGELDKALQDYERRSRRFGK